MKWYLAIVLGVAGGYYYISQHLDFDKTLAYAKAHKEEKWAAPINYYSGWTYYQRSDYGKAEEAFNQLLTDQATSYAYLADTYLYNEDAAEFNHDWEVAKDMCRRYLEEFPEGKEVQLMTKRLELLKYHHP